MSKAIRKKMFEVQKIVEGVKKNATNEFITKSKTKKSYASLDSVIEQLVDQTATKLGLLVLQSVQRDALGPYLFMQIVDVDSNEEISGQMPLILDRNNMQGLGSAVTYSRRYSLLAMFGVAQEDDDGNKAGKKSNSYEEDEKTEPENTNKPEPTKTNGAAAPRTSFGARPQPRN